MSALTYAACLHFSLQACHMHRPRCYHLSIPSSYLVYVAAGQQHAQLGCPHNVTYLSQCYAFSGIYSKQICPSVFTGAESRPALHDSCWVMQWLRKPEHTLRQAQQLPAGTLRRQETSWSSVTLVLTTPGSWTLKQKQGERLKCSVLARSGQVCSSHTTCSGTS